MSLLSRYNEFKARVRAYNEASNIAAAIEEMSDVVKDFWQQSPHLWEGQTMRTRPSATPAEAALAGTIGVRPRHGGAFSVRRESVSVAEKKIMEEAQAQKPNFDIIDKPKHYNITGLEPITAIEAWGLNFHLGNTVKYIARAEHKGTPLEDLKKARFYLDREIKRREKAAQP